MNFSRVKNVIILLLILVNIALFGLCVIINYQKTHISEEETMLARAHLEKIGINVDFENIERKKYNLPIYTYIKEETEQIPKIHIKIAEKFFDCNISGTEFVTTPDGFSVSVKKGTGEPLGTAYYYNDKMLFECQREGFETNIDKEYLSRKYYDSGIIDVDNKPVLEIADKFVSQLMRENTVAYEPVATEEYNGGNIVYFSGVISKTRVMDYFINIYIKDSEIQYLAGNIPNETPKKVYSSKMFDFINAVYHLTENEKVKSIIDTGKTVTVEKQEIVYKLYEYEEDKFYLLPSWHIEYSDDENDICAVVFDAITGEITIDRAK